MKVILKNDTPRLGPKNTILDVSDSYAINVLIKKGIADRLTPALETKIYKDKVQKLANKELSGSKHLQMIESLQKLANNSIDHILLTIKHPHDDKGHLYGSVTTDSIVDAIYNVSKISISPKQIIINSNIKMIGNYKITISGSNGEKSTEFNIVVA